jgi:hypothetical protein
LRFKISHIIIFLILFLSGLNSALAQQNWTHKVRIAGNPLSSKSIESIIEKAVQSNVYGIEVDNDITGRYESFLDPEEKLDEIKRITEEAHKIGNRTFVYIAGLECITANADSKENTFFKDHPDWVQRDINGRPAIFGANDAFWIAEGDEDVWISPYATDWRKIYMQRVREIAATGIDGIYVDIPYWMTHFEGWENTWASFDDYTVQAFKEKTSLDAKREIKLGDFDDHAFIEWIKFRIQTLTEFMAEINKNVKEVNPDCKTIAEIYPGISEEAVRVGADVYQMYNVVDVIAHEYSEGKYYAAERAPVDWINYFIGMQTFRAFADGKASWMLSYSWYKNDSVKPSEAMKSLFYSQLFSGTNMWDVNGYVMSSTNDMQTRTEVYKWVSEYEDIFYSPRTPLAPIGVYFSDYTRNFFSKDFINSYRGIISLLINSHLPYQILTSRTIDNSSPEILILPDVKVLSDNEIESLASLAKNKTKFIVTGEFAKYDENRKVRTGNVLKKLFDKSGNSGINENNNFLMMEKCPGKSYSTLISEDLNKYFNNESNDLTELNKIRENFISRIYDFTEYKPEIKIDAPIDILVSSNVTSDYIYLYLLNIRGICEACSSINKTIKNINISFKDNLGTQDIYTLPFLGKKEKVETNRVNESINFSLPEIDRGTVVLIKRKKSL